MSNAVKILDANFSQQLIHSNPSNPLLVTEQTIVCSDVLAITQNEKNLKAANSRTIVLAPTANITIYCDQLRILGPITTPGKTVRIFARVLETYNDADGAGSAIVVDGKPGDDGLALALPKVPAPGQAAGGCVRCVGKNTPASPGVKSSTSASNGNDGKSGEAAGSISVHFSNGSPSMLRCSANGGKGGSGSKGQDGADGGKGGNGDMACTCFLVSNQAGSDGARGGDGSDGGRGGNAYYGASPGSIRCLIAGKIPKGLQGEARPGKNGTPGTGGDGGRGGPGGDGGSSYSYSQSYGADGAQLNENTIPGGSPGPAGNPGNAGPGGAMLGTQFSEKQSAIESKPLNEVFPAVAESRAWFAMMLARADYDFLAAGDDASSPHLAEATVRYTFIAQIGDAHLAAGQKYDANLSNIFDSARNRMKSMKLGLNYFGLPTDHVPLGSVDYWTDQVKQSIQALKGFEPTYQAYADQLKDQTDCVSSIQAAKGNSNARIAAWRRDAGRVEVKLQGSADLIDKLDNEVAQLNQAVTASLQNLSDQIKSSIGLSWKDLYTGIGSLAFFMGDALNKTSMIVGKAGEFADDGINDLVLDDGSKVKKDVILRRLLVKGRDFSNLPEGFKVVAHQISLGDPNGVKLLQDRQSIDDILDKIASWDTAEETRQRLDTYVTRMNARNQEVLTYNTLIRQVLQRENDIHAEKRHLDEFGSQSAAINPGLPQAVNYMQFVYGSICAQLARSLYLCMRAAAFWSLDSSLSIDTVANSGVDPRQLNSMSAEGWQTEALRQLSEAHEALAGSREPLEKIVVRLDGANAGNRFADLKAGRNYDLHFTLLPVTKETTAQESPFAGYADVRTHQVQVYLRGASTTDGHFKVHLTHLGHETLATPAGQLMSVSHEKRSLIFEYWVDKATGAATVKTPGDNLQGDKDDYAPVGPFANWLVTIDPHLNAGLNLSQLSSIDLIFSGRARPFE